MTNQQARPGTTPMDEASGSIDFDPSNQWDASPDAANERPRRQLDAVIANLGTRATPVFREVAARAAELAARAGMAAGPLAHKAANTTEMVGSRLADRSRTLAMELRRADTTGTAGGDGHGAGGDPQVGPGAPRRAGGTTAWVETG